MVNNSKKKLSEEERKKSRKILLDYIGEEDKKKKEKAEKEPVNKIFTTQAKPKKESDASLLKNEEITSASSLPEKIEITQKPLEKKKENIASQEEKEMLKKELAKTTEKNILASKNKEDEQVKKDETPVVLEKKLKQSKKIKKPKKSKKTKTSKPKKKIKSNSRKNKNKKAEQPPFNFGILEKLSVSLRTIKKNFFVILFLLIIFTIIFYLVFASALLFFRLDNKITHKISKYMPVPVLITSTGYLEYYDYMELISGQNMDRQEIIKKIILLDLLNRYNISQNNKSKETVFEINSDFLNDEEINPDKISLEEYLDKEAAKKKVWFLTI